MSIKNPDQAASQGATSQRIINNEPFDFWHIGPHIARNNFIYKSLSCWALNTAVGCSHGCRFCYVPSASTIKQGAALQRHGVKDPDAEWGKYSLLRPLDEKKFLASLRAAEGTAPRQLNADGNRAILLCSTTDPFQTFRNPNSERNILLNQVAMRDLKKSLEMIRDESSLNVRILTRSPLARECFDLFKTFGDRLLFGMSLPTLNNRLAKIYEPTAPGPSARLKTLQGACDAGLSVYVAVAPTYPECDEADVRKTLLAVKELDPVTIFHEPINIRAENVERIEKHARKLGLKMNTEVFATPEAWRAYAIESLMMVQRVAEELSLGDRLHLWPDESLRSKPAFLRVCQDQFARRFPNRHLTRFETVRLRQEHEKQYEQYLEWLKGWWCRISEWPGAKGNRRLPKTSLAA